MLLWRIYSPNIDSQHRHNAFKDTTMELAIHTQHHSASFAVQISPDMPALNAELNRRLKKSFQTESQNSQREGSQSRLIAYIDKKEVKLHRT